MNRFSLWRISLRWLPKRIGRSAVAIAKLLYFKPGYAALGAVVSVLFYELIFWFLNLGLAQYLMTTPFLSFADKIGLILGSYSGIFTYPFSALSLILFLVSILQGIAVAAITYTIRKERHANRSILKELGGTSIAGIFSVLGLGCAACGTSLVTPLLTFFFASSSIALAEAVGLYAAVIALIVALITVYFAGLKLSAKLTV